MFIKPLTSDTVLRNASEWDNTVFWGYIQEFMKFKFEASGTPDGYDTPEKLAQFIEEELDNFGIEISLTNMKYNAALRTLKYNAALRTPKIFSIPYGGDSRFVTNYLKLL